MQHVHTQRSSVDMHLCIDACLECHRVCLSTLTFGLEHDDTQAESSHSRVMMDCAEFCQIAANFMIRSSRFHNRLCRVCAEICERCGEACEQAGDDAQMRVCIEACRTCADACREMAQSR